MELYQETTEQLITGMTKGELAAVICAVVIIIALIIAIVNYVIKVNMKPLAGIPDKLDNLASKMKTHQEIETMIDVKVQAHELSCRIPQTRRRSKKVTA